MQPIRGSLCSLCGERRYFGYVAALDEDQQEDCFQCPLCRREPPPFARAVAYGGYEEGLRDLIHLLKYDRVLPAANALGGMLARAIARIEPSFGSEPLVVIPVPLSKAKRRYRGFNQAELIARAALKSYSGNRFQLAEKFLIRQRETPSQIGLTRRQRRENIRGAFVVSSVARIASREVLLIDDVYTTGTTASECAQVLRRAGASRVWVATAARTLKLASNESELVSLDVRELRGIGTEGSFSVFNT